MKHNWVYVMGALLIIVALLSAGCKGGLPFGRRAEPKTLRIIFTQEPDSLNPLYTSMWFAALLDQVGLCWAWEFDNNNAAFPRLVTEIPSIENGGVSEDGLTITLHLRDNIVWSDGEPITAADFLFTYDIIMDPANAVDSQYPYDMLASIEAPDERTVVMRFDEPFVPWLGTFWRVVLPRHILEPVYQEQGSIVEAEWNLAPTVGCGPYVFAEWESGSFIRYVRNENYWAGQAKIDEIYVQFVPDDASQTAALVAGDADVGTFPPLSDVPALQEAGLNIMVQSSGYNEGWFFNFRDMASSAIQDVRVRQAIAMALDRQAIADDLLLGLTTVSESYWDGMPEYVSPEIEAWSFDQAAAAQLLEDAGWTDTDGDGIREDAAGNDLTIVHCTTTREVRQDIQAVAQQQLRQVGINLDIQHYDSDILFGSYTDGGPAAVGDCDILEWSDVPAAFPDPDTDYWLCDQIPNDENPWGYNYFGCDEELDTLFRQQLVTINAAERRDIVRRISQIIHDQVYWLAIYSDPDYWIVSDRVTNVSFSGVSPLYSIMEWDIAE